MSTPFTHEKIIEVFGADAADLEDPARLWSFFVENESYGQVRAPHPITLVVGQRGIGKTALMRVSSFDDGRDGTPHIFLKGHQILGAAADTDASSASVNRFKEVIEAALLDHVIKSISTEAAEAVGVPARAGNVIGTLARLAAAVATSQSDRLNAAVRKTTPWLVGKLRQLNVYIDDTDVDWNGSPQAANKVSRLIQACFYLSSESFGDIRFKISLRSDLFNYLAVTSDIIAKIQGGIVRVRWTNDQIFRVIAKRIAIYEDVEYDDKEVERLDQQVVFARYFTPYFEDRFQDVGAWENAPMRHVLLSFIRQRPRDLVGLCEIAARSAMLNDTKIDTRAVKTVIPAYSRGRFNDTVVEFRTELPEIEKLLYEMRAPERRRIKRSVPEERLPRRHYYRHDELIRKLNGISERLALRFSYQSMPARSQDLAEFLFRINFLVATRPEASGRLERLYYDFADGHLQETRAGMWEWEVHMAYRWAIQRDEHAIWQEVSD